MDAMGVNHTSVARKIDKKRNMKFGFCPISLSPNIGMHSASNRFKRSGNLAEWREFVNFRAEKIKFDNIGSENKKNGNISRHRQAVLRMAVTVPSRTI